MSLLLLLRKAAGGLPGFSTHYILHVTNEGDAALTNYQLKLTLDSANFDFSDAQSNGEDLRIAGSDKTTLLDHYISSWNSVAQTAVVWVKVPTIPPGPLSLHLYVGNPDATDTSKTFDTFFAKLATDANTLALWHCDDGTGSTAADATGSYPLTLTNVTWGTGDGGGQDTTQNTFSSGHYLTFNGTSAYASAATGLLDTYRGQGTIEMWVRPKLPLASGQQSFWVKRTDGTASVGYASCEIFDSTGAIQLDWVLRSKTQQAQSAALAWSANTWYHIATTWGNGGFRCYRNGVLVVSLPLAAGWNINSPMPFVIGANAGHNINWFAGDMDEIRVLSIESTPAQIVNDMQRSARYTGVIDQPSKIVYQGTILSPRAGQWDSAIAEEPTGLFHNGTYHLWYTGGTSSSSTNETSFGIGHATSTDGATYTRANGGNPVIGQGHGGEPGPAQHAYVYHDGAQFVALYANTTETGNAGSGLCVATSPDGDTWTPNAGNPVLPMVLNTWESCYGNSYIVTDDNGLLWLFYTALDSTGVNWRSGIATANSLAGPWTKRNDNPQPTIGYPSLYNGVAAAIYGHIQIPIKLGSTYHAWMHSFPIAGYPYGIVHATSTDLVTWTLDPTATHAPWVATQEGNGVRDPVLFEANGTTHLIYSQFPLSSAFAVGHATYAGTLAELVTDLSAPALTF